MNKKLLSLTCAIYAIRAITVTYITYFTAKIIEGAENGDMSQLLHNCLIAFIAFVISLLIDVAQELSNQYYLYKGDLSARGKAFRNLFRKPVSVFKKKDDAYYINLFTTDISLYRERRLGAYPWIAYFIASSVSAVIMLAKMSGWLVAGAVAMGLIPFFAGKALTKWVSKRNKIYSDESEIYMKELTEDIQAYEVIRQDGSQDRFIDKYMDKSARMRKSAALLTIANNFSQQVLYESASLLQLVAVSIGAVMVIKGIFSAAMLFAVSGYAIQISNAFSNIIEYTVMIKSVKEIVAKINEEPEINFDNSKKLSDNAALHLQYKNLACTFDDKKIFSNFNYDFEPGKCYAVIGESGAGKSTLFKLLLKYYDNYEGDILLDGINLRDLSEDEIYKRINVVNQEARIFNTNLYENITMQTGYPLKDSDLYREILDSLKLTEFSKQVMDRNLGDCGDMISGGERQRICIARAMRKKAGLLIFDEPTTGLDPENAGVINDFIFAHKEATRIVITHNRDEEFLKRFDGVVYVN